MTPSAGDAQSIRNKMSEYPSHLLMACLGRDVHPTGICRVAASHARAILSNGYDGRLYLALGAWQIELFQKLLGPYKDGVEYLIADIDESSLSRNSWYLRTLPRLARRCGADLVHLSFPAPVLSRSFQAPVILTLHDLYPYDIPENFGFPQYLANRAILRQCLHSVTGIACVSATTSVRLNALFPNVTRTRETVVAGNYVEDPCDVVTKPRAAQQLKEESFILTVAQHRKNKNLDCLIRAFSALVSEQGFAGPLVIVGINGPETAALEKLVLSLDLVDRVVFLRSIEDSELSWLYSKCSAFVVCSSLEGYCLPLMEARARGAKVVCTDIPILREVGGPDCIYVPLGSDTVRELSEAIGSRVAAQADVALDLQALRTRVLNEYLKLYSMCRAHTSPSRWDQSRFDFGGRVIERPDQGNSARSPQPTQASES